MIKKIAIYNQESKNYYTGLICRFLPNIPNSIISRINSNQINVKVDTYFITCFNKAKEVWKNTNGAFDPTVTVGLAGVGWL
jgi:thiamine biosynthesis lipoprotein ApbE